MAPLKLVARSLFLGLGLAALFIGGGVVLAGEYPIVAVAFFEPALALQNALLGPDGALQGLGTGEDAQYRTTMVIGFLLWWGAFTLLSAALLVGWHAARGTG